MKSHRAIAAALTVIGIAASAFAQGKLDYSAAMTGARVHYKGSRWQKAAALFRVAITEKPTLAEPYFWLGLSLAQIGGDSLPAAAEQFSKSFSLDTSYITRALKDEENVYLSTKALASTAAAKMLQADSAGYRDAARFIRWAIALNPNNPQYYMTLGNAYVGLDMADSIRVVSEDIVKRDPQNAQGPFFMAIYYSKKADLDTTPAGKSALMDSTLRSFQEAGFRYESAMQKLKDKLAAILKLTSVADADPIALRLVALRNDQAELKKYIEETLQAAKSLREVADVANNLFIDRFQAGLAFYRAGMAAVQQAHASNDTIVQKKFFALGDTLFSHAVAADPENYDAMWYIGYVNYRMLKDEATVAAFRKAIELSASLKDMIADKDAEVWMYMGTSEAKLKQYDSAVVHLKRAIAANPTASDNYKILSAVYAEMSKLPGGKAFEDSAVAIYDAGEKTGWRVSAWMVTNRDALGELKPAGGQVFAVVEVTLFNKTMNTASVEPAGLSLVCDDKKTYAVDLPATGSPEMGGRGIYAADVEANSRLEGVAVFAIPKEARPQTLVYKPATGTETSAPIR